MDANVHTIQPFRALPAPRDRREREPKKRFELVAPDEARGEVAEAPAENAALATRGEEGVGSEIDVVA
jgi:hypothetical protein